MAEEKPKGARRQIDWESVEQAFRLGEKSLRKIAADHGITEGAVRKKAKADLWERDLSARVRKATAAKLVRETVRTANIAYEGLSEKQIVEAASDVRVTLQGSQQRRISKLAMITEKITDKLEALTEIEISDLPTAKQAADVIERVTRATSQLIQLERQAFGMDDVSDNASSGGSNIDALLKRIGTLASREAEYEGAE